MTKTFFLSYKSYSCFSSSFILFLNTTTVSIHTRLRAEKCTFLFRSVEHIVILSWTLSSPIQPPSPQLIPWACLASRTKSARSHPSSYTCSLFYYPNSKSPLHFHVSSIPCSVTTPIYPPDTEISWSNMNNLRCDLASMGIECLNSIQMVNIYLHPSLS